MNNTLRNLIFYLFTVIISILIQSCSDNARIEDVEISSDPGLVLMKSVRFNTSKPSDAFIEYWQFSDSAHQYSSLSAGSTNHVIQIINLVPDQEYSYKVHIKSGDRVNESQKDSFITGSLPKDFPGFKKYEDEFDLPGYVLIKTFHKYPALIILNNNGQIVWYHPYDRVVVRPFDITHENHIISLVDSSYIEEIDLFGNLINQLDTRDFGIDKLHHELIKNKDNKWVGLTYERQITDLSAFGGLKNDTVKTDGIVVFDSEGNIDFKWSVFDVLDPKNDSDILSYKSDWGHANSISYDNDGHFLVSFRDFSQIWKINASSGKLIWRLGRGGDFEIEDESLPLKQHSAHIDRHNNLLMFDNGDHIRGYSRILSLKNNEDDQWFRVLDQKLDKNLTTFRMGSANYIDEEHILVCSPKKLLNLVVLNTQGKIVWRINGTSDSYRAIFLPPEFLENKRWF